MCASAIAVTRFVAPGPEGRDRDADLVRRRGIPLGRVARALFVADEDVADRGRGHQLVVERDDRAAGEAEDVP